MKMLGGTCHIISIITIRIGLLFPIFAFIVDPKVMRMSSQSSSESEQQELGDKQTSSLIWTTAESKILQSYIDAYKQEPVKKKKACAETGCA